MTIKVNISINITNTDVINSLVCIFSTFCFSANNQQKKNYDFATLPYGDLNYLTMPLDETMAIEPLVEIKTDSPSLVSNPPQPEVTETPKQNEAALPESPESTDAFPKTLGTIGECTISLN